MTPLFGALRTWAPVTIVALAVSTASVAVPSGPARAEETPGKVLFILDASGSMWGEVRGEDKIAVAKRVMTELVRQLPEGLEAGLEIYGHRRKGDCQDIEITLPPARGNRDAMIRQIQSITPKGMTPITGSLQVAAEALRGSEQQTSIVLVSDGQESCEADPCAAITAIRAQGINVRVHVVGFDVKAAERQQLQCIADAGGGKYFSADDADQLTAALAEVRKEVTEAPKAEEPPAQKTVKLLPETGTVTTVNGDSNVYLLDARSNEQLSSMLGDGARREVRTGTYKVRYGQTFVVAEIEVKAGETVTLDADAWLATVATKNGLSNVYLLDPESGDQVAGMLGNDASEQVPAGTYRVRYGLSFEVDTIELKPAQTVTLDARKWFGTVTATTVKGGSLRLVDPGTNENVATIPSRGGSVQVPAGSYKLRLGGKTDIGTIDVVAGEELVIE